MVDFQVRVGDFGGELVCHVEDQRKERRSGRTVGDAEAARTFVKLRQDMPRHRVRCCLAPAAPMWLASVNLACHELGDRAVRSLVEALLAGRVRVGVVELYKNQLGDASAQALATLVERSPAPGVTGLHLSHNYFTPLGVELMLGAAAVCGHYPRRRNPQATDFVPLWLRIERQQCKWPVLGGLAPEQQLREAQKLIGMKEETLLSRARARGVVPLEPLPEGFKLICIPVPRNGARSADIAYDEADGARGNDDYAPFCCSTRCCSASEYGPAVHLPYFWSQNGLVTKEKMPEHASLSQRDKAWRNWTPAKPIGLRDRPPAPESDAAPAITVDSAPALSDSVGSPRSSAAASSVQLPISGGDTPIKSEPGLDNVKDGNDFSDVKVGDDVVVDGQKGTVFWDGRPKYDFVKVRWSADNSLSKIIPIADVMLALCPAEMAAPERACDSEHCDSRKAPTDFRPLGMTLVPELKLQEPERSVSPLRQQPMYVPPMRSSGGRSKQKRDGRPGLPVSKAVEKAAAAPPGVRKRAGSAATGPAAFGKRLKPSPGKTPASFPKDLD